MACIYITYVVYVFIGHNIKHQHYEINFSFGSPTSPLSICGLIKAEVELLLFNKLISNIKPTAMKSRRICNPKTNFISDEIKK